MKLEMRCSRWAWRFLTSPASGVAFMAAAAILSLAALRALAP
jgi:hypothetical protein